MDLGKTLLLGGEDAWIGRLVFGAPYSSSGMFDFYKAEMPKFGWREITVVRSETSVMTYQRQGRVATVELTPSSVAGTTVRFTVSPEGMAVR